ncbi:hypothetical protein CDN98_18420 [Roseateles terrae]|nr:hypothetical protein CDN98_18420 [Roseateles terrae]
MPVARTDGRFSDFKPYVPSINDAGVVCFQAGLRNGGTGLFTAKAGGAEVAEIAVSGSASCPVAAFTSHPDINDHGDVTAYARLPSGDEVLALLRPGAAWQIVGSRQGLYGIGPLGPTMNESGRVALRATTARGTASIELWDGHQFTSVAEAGDTFSGFAGLPVVNAQGDVAFRASLRDSREGVFLRTCDGLCRPVAVTGGDFEDIAPFPTLNDLGAVAFVARPRSSADWGIYVATSDGLTCWRGPYPDFASYRGVLMNRQGPAVFYGTPTGGTLGIYSGSRPKAQRLLGLGDPLLGSTVTDFALNPVSVNERGQIAVRVALQNGRQYILRGDPR